MLMISITHHIVYQPPNNHTCVKKIIMDRFIKKHVEEFSANILQNQTELGSAVKFLCLISPVSSLAQTTSYYLLSNALLNLSHKGLKQYSYIEKNQV